MLIGVLSGVLTTILVYVSSLFLKRVVLPNYRIYLYRGLDITGQWRVKQDQIAVDGEELSVKRETTVVLKQKGHDLEGRATSTALGGGAHQAIYTYAATGEIKDRFVMLSFKADDRDRIGYSSFLLEVVGDGRRMVGYRVFYALLRRKVSAISVEFERQKESGETTDAD